MKLAYSDIAPSTFTSFVAFGLAKDLLPLQDPGASPPDPHSFFPCLKKSPDMQSGWYSFAASLSRVLIHGEPSQKYSTIFYGFSSTWSGAMSGGRFPNNRVPAPYRPPQGHSSRSSTARSAPAGSARAAAAAGRTAPAPGWSNRRIFFVLLYLCRIISLPFRNRTWLSLNFWRPDWKGHQGTGKAKATAEGGCPPHLLAVEVSRFRLTLIKIPIS